MLRIHQIESAATAKRYHRESLTKGDYYQDAQEVGTWHGKLAKELGLIGETKKEDFDQMVDNTNPNTGNTLTQRRAVGRRPGYDFTFSCPKGQCSDVSWWPHRY